MSEQQDAPELSESDEQVLAAVGMDPLEWRQIWVNHARATGEGVIPPAELEKETAALRKAGKYDEAMAAAISHQMGPVVTIPRQPDFHSLSPRLQAEALRRGVARMKPDTMP